MAVSQRTERRLAARARPQWLQRLSVLARPPSEPGRGGAPVRPLASPGQIAVIYRWGAWLLALGLILSGQTATFGRAWWAHGDVFLLLGLTLAVNILLTVALRPYLRLVRRYPPILALDIVFCLAVYSHSDIWTSPFQFYSYASLMLPVAIFFFAGALASSALFLMVNLALLYAAGDSLAWAVAHGVADTYVMQLAIVPLLAFVFAYPNRLYAQLRRAQRQLSLAERERLLAFERTRIAQSLHDSVAQILFGIQMLAESALAARHDQNHGPSEASSAASGMLSQVRDLATRGNQEVRRAIFALNDPSVSRRGLAHSLQAMLEDFEMRTGVATHLAVAAPANASATPVGPATTSHADARSEPRLDRVLDAPPATETAAAQKDSSSLVTPSKPPGGAVDTLALTEGVADALYRIAREALANVEKHAGANGVWVELTVEPVGIPLDGQQAKLVIRDDGRGFQRPWLADADEPDEDEPGHFHFGMFNMRHAAEAAGGQIHIKSTPGGGTTITARVPLR